MYRQGPRHQSLQMATFINAVISSISLHKSPCPLLETSAQKNGTYKNSSLTYLVLQGRDLVKVANRSVAFALSSSEFSLSQFCLAQRSFPSMNSALFT